MSMATLPPATVQVRTGQSLTIRSATADDASALVALTRAVTAERRFLVMEPEEFDLSEDDERRRIQTYLDASDRLALVAERDGHIDGALWCEAGGRKRLAHRATFHMLVERDYRGRGVGTALLETLIRWAEQHPTIEKLGLAVLATNTPAINVYRRLGFLEEGRRIHELKLGLHEYTDDILMYRFV